MEQLGGQFENANQVTFVPKIPDTAIFGTNSGYCKKISWKIWKSFVQKMSIQPFKNRFLHNLFSLILCLDRHKVDQESFFAGVKQ